MRYCAIPPAFARAIDVIRRLILACLFIGAFGNTVPSLAQIRPQSIGLGVVEDDLTGSGYEARQERPTRLPAKRLGYRRPLSRLGDAVAAIGAAGAELQRREPGLGNVLAEALPRIQRDDIVGTMIRSGDSIRFNRTYVLSLSPDQLLDHMWQIAVSLQSPY
jgi:hypothetical protein